MPKKTRKTIKENSTGGNKKFINLKNLTEEQRKTLVKKIENGEIDGYHIMKKGRKKWPRSNPDRSKKNNLDPIIKRPTRKKK
jgi:ribosome recycling factor